MNYFQFHIGDYAAHTQRLSLMEDLAYRRMIDTYMLDERPFNGSSADVARAIGMMDQLAAVEYVLGKFFTRSEAGFCNARCDREIAHFQDKQSKASSAGRASAERRLKQKATDVEVCSTDVQLTNNQEPITKNQERDKHAAHAPVLRSEDRPSSVSELRKPKASIPDCPHVEILELWAEVLPSLPQHLPSQWRGARAQHLKTRWRECAVEKGWVSQTEGLGYFRKLFGYVGQSQFLSGRARSINPSRPSFQAELEWLVMPANWAKTIEGKYHQEQAA